MGGIFDEIQLLKRIRSANPQHPGFQHCCQLIETFNATSSYGEHVCLVTEALGMDLGVYRTQFNRRTLPVQAVKRITKQTLLALDYLHRECNIIHTDLKPENAMLAPPTSHDAITRHLEKFPSELYPSYHEESISDDSIITVKSQPLPALDVSANGSNISIKVGDFGHSSWVHKQLREEIQPEALRAPEVIIGYPWSTPADIWSLGYLAFEYLKGIPLFDSLDEFKGVSPVDLHLLRILQVSNDSEYPKEMVARSSRQELFFTAEGRLRRLRTRVKTNLEEPLRGSQIPEHEIKPAVAFIQRCIRIRPEDRATAQELLSDPWLEE
ncbi:hypothetical protein FRC05_004793 [Tulasnella sp. 425]|nr:hypothetical protein FRC05_004793 [Tulasnella sp. 425]